MDSSFHKYERKLERTAAAVSAANIPSASKRAILRFRDSCFSEGLSVPRIEKYLMHLKQLAPRFGKPFHAATRADVERVVAGIEQTALSPWTKRDYRIALKKFYRWLRGTDENPPEVAWLRSDVRSNRRKLPDELLTEDDISALIDACHDPRDRALVAILYESGCRIGELATMKLKHMVPHPHGLRLIVSGKTGARRLLVISCAPYVTEWLNAHPLKRDSDAYLWVSTDSRRQRLGYARISGILRAAATKASITKSVNPHAFRHSRATHLANHFTEAQMKEYFGWVQSSEMAATYVHLSGRDIDNALLKTHGIDADDGKPKEARLRPKPCPRCEFRNAPTNRLCGRCGSVLDEQAAKDIIRRDLDRDRADSIMDRLIQDDEFRAILEKKLNALVSPKP